MPTTSNVSHLLVVLSIGDDQLFSIDHLTDEQRATIHEHAGNDIYGHTDDVMQMVTERVFGVLPDGTEAEKWIPLANWSFTNIKSVVFLLT